MLFIKDQIFCIGMFCFSLLTIEQKETCMCNTKKIYTLKPFEGKKLKTLTIGNFSKIPSFLKTKF